MTDLAGKAAGTLAAGAASFLAIAAAGLQALTPAPLAPTGAATAQIPATYLALYQAAAGRCPMPWTILAAVGQVESDQGRDTASSAAGALGPMQFEPATWAAWSVDGDGDGRKDPADPADAIPAAADYLCSLGVAVGPHDALVAYNCGNTSPACQSASAGYTATVLSIAAGYATSAGTTPATHVAVQAAQAEVGTPYLWGGDGPGGFDCSGLVQYAYAQAGLALPRTAQQQYDATVHLPDGTSPQPGDLLFFGAGPRAVEHVGIALGDGTMIDAPHSGALVRVEDAHWADYLGATRPGGRP